jgi:hypothetical protein
MILPSAPSSRQIQERPFCSKCHRERRMRLSRGGESGAGFIHPCTSAPHKANLTICKVCRGLWHHPATAARSIQGAKLMAMVGFRPKADIQRAWQKADDGTMLGMTVLKCLLECISRRVYECPQLRGYKFVPGIDKLDGIDPPDPIRKYSHQRPQFYFRFAHVSG